MTVGNSAFGLADISCPGGGCGDPADSSFRQWVSCNQCYNGTIQVGTTYPILDKGVSDDNNNGNGNGNNNGNGNGNNNGNGNGNNNGNGTGNGNNGDVATTMRDLARRQAEFVVPVFRSNSTFTIIGFARFVLTDVISWKAQGADSCTSDCKAITGYFIDYTLPASLSDGNGAGLTDFGVRAIGLTN
jgi:hypothetical protein